MMPVFGHKEKLLWRQIDRNKESGTGVVSIRMPYRDDDHALHDKKEQLKAERAHIAEQKRAFQYLADHEKRIDCELADIEQRLAKRRKKLPLLGEIRNGANASGRLEICSGKERTEKTNRPVNERG